MVVEFMSHPVVAFGVPYAACLFGTFIADMLSLYPGVKRLHLYLMSVPVTLVTVGILLSATTVSVPVDSPPGTIREYCCGHTQSIPGFGLFVGTMIFYGTLAPDLFAKRRDGVR